jgi:hypothetical protein
MFDRHASGYLVPANKTVGRIGVKTMAILSGRRYSWLFIIWVIVGLVVAWTHSYITVYLLKLVLSALLTIFLWPLVLLGINLHIH